MIANDARVTFGIYIDAHAIADVQRFLGDDFVSDEPRDGVISPGHFGEQLGVGVVIEAASVGHLTTRLGVNHSAIQHHLARFADLQLTYRPALSKNRLNPGVLRRRPVIKTLLRPKRLRNLRVSRAHRLLAPPTFPRSPRPGFLLLHGLLETFSRKRYVCVAVSVLDEVSREPIGVVKHEREIPGFVGAPYGLLVRK